MMKALQIFAGPRALLHLRDRGLSSSDVRVIPAAAGGPKGLALLPLDRFLFGEWLPQSTQPIDLVGASIGAWRMAAACLNNPVDAMYSLQQAYIHQNYDVPPGRKSPTRAHVSERFGIGIEKMFARRLPEVLEHARYRLHVVTSRGRGVLARDGRIRAPLGYAAAYITNLVSRKSMSALIERTVFSTRAAPLPFAGHDYRTRRYPLTESNFSHAVQASCSIPFVLDAVHDIPGAQRGAYWDGGITDYHLHLDYRDVCGGESRQPDHADVIDAAQTSASNGVVLYPHFQRAVVPGWLDKSLKWRHRPSAFLDDVIVLAPNPEWVATLPNGKLPDRTDFMRYGTDLDARVDVWSRAAGESQQLADEFAEWVAAKGAPLDAVTPL
jgi:hypothetical protein